MKRFYITQWDNKRREMIEKTMLIVNQCDILKKRPYAGSGWEILVLPHIHKNSHDKYVKELIYFTKMRCGKIVYV